PKRLIFVCIVVTCTVDGLGAWSRLEAQPRQPASATSRTLEPPEPIATAKATYPAAALAEHKEGSVTILATVDKQGAVTAAEIAESSGEGILDEAALNAALKWRFRPAKRDGLPTESQVRIP